MKVIGINYLSESSVCLVENGIVKYAISEERLNRKKNWYGIPYASIKKLLKDTKNKISDIDLFATCGLSSLVNDVPDIGYLKKKIYEIKVSKLSKKIKKKQISFLKKRSKHEDYVINVRTRKIIDELKKKFKNLKVFDHHTSHAASAVYNSNFSECYCLTIDGWGDNASAKIFFYQRGKIREINKTSSLDSLCYFYGSITKLLGFKPHQHEGKILGLAAYGDPKKAMKDMSKLISYDKENKRFKANYEKGIYQASFNNKNLNFLKRKYSAQDIAACAQFLLEKVVLECVNDLSKNKFNLALAGGIFANVKLNQKIKDQKIVKKIYVFPNMGDGGLSIGSALLAYYQKNKKIRVSLKNCYLGPQYYKDDLLKEIKKYRLKFLKPKNIEKEIAFLLNKGLVVAHFNNRMEFGPRALGNRSILCSAKNKNINDILNKKLGRTEFMPFAPIVLEKSMRKYFKIKDSLNDYKFMTITCDCKKIMINNSPAAVHIDNTARPQMINKKISLRLFKILNEYKKITKIPVLINTSFNMHEEPIVCSPNDAIRAFLASKIDYLILEKYLIQKP